MSDGRARSRATSALILLTGLGLALRLAGVRFGLPAVYNPDEIAIMSRALALAKGDLNPHNFLYPSFFFYALAAWVGAYIALAMALGQTTFALVQSQFFRDPTTIYLAGRLLGVACGTATIAATYCLGARWFDRTTGLAAAGFLAVAPIAVRDAHYVKHDVPVTLLTILSLIAIGRLLDRSRIRLWRDVAIAAGLVGAAASTHYYTVFLVVPLTLVIFLTPRIDRRATRVRALVLAGVVCLIAFAALSPFIVIDWRTALRDVAANRQIVMERASAGGSTSVDGLLTYLGMLGGDALGWAVAALAAAGFFMILLRSRELGALLLSFPIVFLLFLSRTVPAGRYLNPILPIAVICAGVAVSRFAQAVAERQRTAAAAVLAALACVPGAASSWRIDRLFRQDDTRTLAHRFIDAQIPRGSSILIQPYSVDLRPSRESLRETLRANGVSEADAPVKVQRLLTLDPYPEPSYRVLYLGDGGRDSDRFYVHYSELGRPGLDRLRELGVQYLVVTRYRSPQASTRPFLSTLPSEARRLAVLSPYVDSSDDADSSVEPFLHNTNARPDARLARPGPVIEIWKL